MTMVAFRFALHRSRLPGFTLVELLTVITIIGLMAGAAVPSFRGAQARQALKGSQQGIVALLTQMQQLALAPASTTSATGVTPDYDVLGYGVYFGQRSLQIADCTLEVSNDFVALMKIVRLHNSEASVTVVPHSVQPATANASGCSGVPKTVAARLPNDFYVLAKGTHFNPDRSIPSGPFPRFIFMPLTSVDSAIGPLTNLPDGATLLADSAKIVIEHSSAKVGTGAQERSLSRFITVSRNASEISISSGINQ
jgi:prepilin-type N-terminal cleavage/methylation domain-containing protein